MTMEFGSLRRKGSSCERSKENRKKTFSISNISFTSGNSSSTTGTTTTVVRKSLSITLPRDLGIQQDVDCRVVKVSKGGSAHLSGVIQVGDLVNVFPNDLEELRHSPSEEHCPLNMPDDEFVNVNIIYGVLQVESRPLCPLMVEIGNRNNTSLGLALADAPGEKIRISSIQPGSLAERCGYLKPGDVLISIQVRENETLSCSPYYTSYETAQILRSITNNMPSVALTILPYEAEQLQLQKQHISLFNMLSSTAVANTLKYKNTFGSESTLIPDCGQNENTDDGDEDDSCTGGAEAGVNNFRDDLQQSDHNHDDDDDDDDDDVDHDDHDHGDVVDLEQEDQGKGPPPKTSYTVLSFSLWKDRLYEDWGFSLTDSMGEENQTELRNKKEDGNCTAGASSNSKASHDHHHDHDSGSGGSKRNRKGDGILQGGSGSEILQIRPGGPAFVAGLKPGDRIMQINRQDVAHLESTMLVPILASLDDSLNLTVIRIRNESNVKS